MGRGGPPARGPPRLRYEIDHNLSLINFEFDWQIISCTGNLALPHLHSHPPTPPSTSRDRSHTSHRITPAHVQNHTDAHPFHGNFRGACWNAQGLYHANAAKQRDKWARIKQLLNTHDFLLVSETHSTPGKAHAASAMLARQGLRAYWSHATTRRAGVAIIIKDLFLRQFTTAPPHHREIVPGEINELTLHGPQGHLAIYSIYLPTGSVAKANGPLHELRSHHRTALAAAIPCPSTCLSIIGGDFNYVSSPTDRTSLSHMLPSQTDDSHDQRDWEAKLNATELYQAMATHTNSQARSRIDRVYTTQAITCQLDYKVGCAPLEWNHRLSHHRPLSFFRMNNLDSDNPPARSNTIPDEVIKRYDWPIRVIQQYRSNLLTSIDTHSEIHGSPPEPGTQAFYQLDAVKQAIRSTSDAIQEEIRLMRDHARAEETDDKLGWTMRCLRAVERNHTGTVRRAITAYPTLRPLVTGQDHTTGRHINKASTLTLLQDHALQLNRASTLQQLRQIQHDTPHESEGVIQARRRQVQERIRRMKPGACNSVAVLQSRTGALLTSPEDIATELHDYWHDTFRSTPTDHDLRHTWFLTDVGSPGPWHDALNHQWQVTHSSISRALKKSSKSAPGPDGIPYLAWQKLGKAAEHILHDVASAISNNPIASLAPAHVSLDSLTHFNLGHMVFIPKKATGTDPLLGDYFSPGDVRPLLIVNTDNRLIANAMRIQWEPALDEWISPMQQGFLPGRSMASNVIDIETQAQTLSLTCDKAGIILLDFKAAFPSIDHSFLFHALEALALPPCLRTGIRNLYHEHHCLLQVASRSNPGFPLLSGIRQGCPISPLLFALTMDVVLRRLQRLLPAATIRAFADDIAIVVPDTDAAWPIMTNIFHELQSIAGLSLNKPKCVLIPLWTRPTTQIASDIARRFPAWATVTITRAARYLGVVIGPDSEDTFWDQALRKYSDRARQWGQVEMGLQFSLIAYHTYVLPTLGFLLQFRRPSEAVLKAELKALRALLPGPANWFTLEDASYFKDSWGLPINLTTVTTLSLAARTRLSNYENRSHGGLHIRSRHRQLRDTIRLLIQPGHWATWHTWYTSGLLNHLHDADSELRQLGISANAVRSKLALSLKPSHHNDHPPRRNSDLTAQDIVRRSFQKTLRLEIHAAQRPHHIPRLRHKLDRWDLPGLPAHNATITHQALIRLRNLVPPRVSAAVLRTIFNGWMTKRRFQVHAHCLFGCNNWHDADSLEHYASCPSIHLLRHKRLNLRLRPWHKSIFLALHLPRDSNDDNTLTKVALLIYAVYRTHNAYRHDNTHSHDSRYTLDVMDQHIVEGALGHPRATSVLDTAYLRSPRPGKAPTTDTLTSQIHDGALDDLAIYDLN